MTLQVLAIVISFAIDPENHSVEPVNFMDILKQLDINVYQYKIASVAALHKQQNDNIKRITNQILTGLRDMALSTKRNSNTELTFAEAGIGHTKMRLTGLIAKDE